MLQNVQKRGFWHPKTTQKNQNLDFKFCRVTDFAGLQKIYIRIRIEITNGKHDLVSRRP